MSAGAATLFVKVVPPGGADAASRATTRTLLMYVRDSKARLRARGLAIRVVGVPFARLRDPAAVAALHQRGVTALPALVNPHGSVYLGLDRIVALLRLNLGEAPPPAPPPPPPRCSARPTPSVGCSLPAVSRRRFNTPTPRLSLPLMISTASSR